MNSHVISTDIGRSMMREQGGFWYDCLAIAMRLCGYEPKPSGLTKEGSRYRIYAGAADLREMFAHPHSKPGHERKRSVNEEMLVHKQLEFRRQRKRAQFARYRLAKTNLRSSIIEDEEDLPGAS